MKNLNLAIILNAFVMPGSGHIVLGLRLKGFTIGALTLIFLLFPIAHYTAMVMNVLSQVRSMDDPRIFRTMDAISNAWHMDKNLILVCMLAVVVLWLYGILDLVLVKRCSR